MPKIFKVNLLYFATYIVCYNACDFDRDTNVISLPCLSKKESLLSNNRLVHE